MRSGLKHCNFVCLCGSVYNDCVQYSTLHCTDEVQMAETLEYCQCLQLHVQCIYIVLYIFWSNYTILFFLFLSMSPSLNT